MTKNTSIQMRLPLDDETEAVVKRGREGGQCHQRAVKAGVGCLIILGALGFLWHPPGANREVTSPRQKRQSVCEVDVCLTPECVHAASSLLAAMDTSADPCHNFFQYACGGWMKENRHKTNKEPFYAVNQNVMQEEVDITLSELMRKGGSVPKEVLKTKPYKDLFLFHEKCLGVAQQEGNLEQVNALLKNLKEFQVGRTFQPKFWNLTKAVLELLSMNGAPLFDVDIDADVENSSRFSLIISSPLRFGLLPALVKGRRRRRRRPDLQQFFRGRVRQALFGNTRMEDLLTEALQKARAGREGGAGGGLRRRPTYPQRRLTHSLGPDANPPHENLLPDVKKEAGDEIEDSDDSGGKVSPSKDIPMTGFSHPHVVDITLVTPSSTTTPEERPGDIATPNMQPEAITTTLPIHSGQQPVKPILSAHPPTTTTTTTTTTRPAITTVPQSTTSSTVSYEDAPTTTDQQDDVNNTLGSDDGAAPTIASLHHDLHSHVISRKFIYMVVKNSSDSKRLDSLITTFYDFFPNLTLPFPEPQLEEELERDEKKEEEEEEEEEGEEEEEEEEEEKEDLFSSLMMRFILILEQIHPSEREQLEALQQDLLYQQTSLHALSTQFPDISWGYLLKELLNMTITEEDHIYIYFPEYLTQLHILLHNTEPWVIHYGLLTMYLHDVLLESVYDDEDIAREDFCLQASKSVFGEVMSNLYLHHIGNTTLRNIRTHADSIVDLLKEEVAVSVRGAEWLTAEDKTEALKKVMKMELEVGAFDRHWDIAFVNQSHRQLEFREDMSFLEMVVELYRTFRTEMYNLYHQPVEKKSFIWSYTVQPYVVNAFHLQSTNSIVFPEAFFHAPYYQPKAPEYLNYGSTATAMAHELFHGLDFLGLLFDHRGSKSRPFSQGAMDHLKTTHSCYHDIISTAFYREVQFGYNTVTMEIDSNFTMNENLADTAGIRHSFRAYQRWVEGHYTEPSLPALPHHPDQLFFLAAAQPYCAVIPDLAKIFLMEIDEHPPNDLRINALMMNTPEFTRVFNCSAYSRMKPASTCHLFP